MRTPIRHVQPLCLWCHSRPALARVRGIWRVVKHHDVCRQCWRSFMDSRAAAKLAAYERLMADRNSRRRGTLRASRSRTGARGPAVEAISQSAERALRAR